MTAMSDEHQPENTCKIVVRPNGPYRVYGGIPLVRKTQIVSEQVEPLTWETGETLETKPGEFYSLCRCGHSRKKPFCDGTHKSIDFDGTETADTHPTAERQRIYPGGEHIVARQDRSLCSLSGFCGNRKTNIARLMRASADIDVRSQVIAMIERCPSGSLTYSMEADSDAIEPDLPAQVAVTTEMTSAGPIAGPLWVTGSIPIERSDGQPMERRNRVTLCNCGKSKNKPLCDGSHRPEDD
jgi:CDGSH-type Zn-finger protein